jgi:hypothetical protein
MFELLNNVVDITDPATITVPNVDTTLKTYNIPENRTGYVLLMASIMINQTGTATAQNVTIKVKDGTTVVKSFVFGTTAVAKSDIVPIILPIRKNTAGAINVTVSGAAADAQTSVALRSFLLAFVD